MSGAMRWKLVLGLALTVALALLLCALPVGRSGGRPEGYDALRQLLLENRALSRQAATASPAEQGPGLAERYRTLRAGKLELLRRLDALEAAPELEVTVAAASSAIGAEARLLALLEERFRREHELGEAREAYLAALSRVRGVPTSVEPRDPSRYLRYPDVRAALERRQQLERRVEELAPVRDGLIIEVRARHARLDDLAFSAGLVPYRTGPPF